METHFVHLRLHTEFSLKDGLIRIPKLLDRCVKFKFPAIAITDLNNLYATIKFYQRALSQGIKPILGADILVAQEDGPKIFTLLCKNNLGYQNLLKLISKSHLENQHLGLPIIQKEWLEALNDGLILLASYQSDLGQSLLATKRDLAQQQLQYWQALFPDRFYLELSRVGKPHEADYSNQILSLAEQTQTPIVATNDTRFLNREDFEAHEARVCIQQGCTLNDPNRKRHYTEQQYLRSEQEMLALFADIPEALQNTVEIAKRCNVNLELGTNLLPKFTVPSDYTTESYLIAVAQRGLKERLDKLAALPNAPDTAKQKIYYDRLKRELAVINKMGFAGYFLIVADFTKWAKENGIPVGPGRGSGPGSLVAYALNITDLDPIALDLLFERFLNPERISMPDFDIDFCMDGRDKVIEYVIQTHGKDSVAQIITYGTMAARAVVRDVGRILGFSYGFVDKIAKLIPFELGITLEKALVQEPLLTERYEAEEDVRTLIELARKLEGITRNVGKHAGGIVIAPGKLTDFVPLYCEENDSSHPVTQFDKDDVETVGLVKFDFLGLKTLTIIDRALHIINEQKAALAEDAIDITLIALDDAKTFQLLKACQSMAVFQLESHGMRDLIKRLQPDCFDDLVALVALFRPGPLQSGMVDDFINRKHGRAKVLYPHPLLEPVLKPTYGVILYQEQVMQIAQVLAGYTLGAADILRRAMGKKKPEEMAKQRVIFCRGAKKGGVNVEVANHIFDLMEKFAGYGFNKSHSAAYALIAYQTAWLKTHYPAAFMAAVLSSEMDRTEKIILLLEECRSLKLHMAPPDINESSYYFKVLDTSSLRYGLGAIKGIGAAAIENILTARQENGAFKDLFDLCTRIDLRKVNRRVLEALIKSGALDSLHKHRATLMASLNNALLHAEQATHNRMYGQHDLLAMHVQTTAVQYIEAKPWPSDIQLSGEKESLGFYLTGHPLNRYINETAAFTSNRIIDLKAFQQKSVRIAGMINTVKLRQTKRGDRMAVFSLDDGSTHIEVVCFSECFQRHRSLLVEDQLVIVEGDMSVDDFNNSVRLLCNELYTLDQARIKFAKRLKIQLETIEGLDIRNLQTLLSKHRGGKCPVTLNYRDDGIQTTIQLGKEWLIIPCESLLNDLTDQLKTSAEFLYQ